MLFSIGQRVNDRIISTNSRFMWNAINTVSLDTRKYSFTNDLTKCYNKFLSDISVKQVVGVNVTIDV